MAVTKKQSVYLAGAMVSKGWRHLLVQGFSDEPLSQSEFPILPGGVFGMFDYTGPFPVLQPMDEFKMPDNFQHDEKTWSLRRDAIARADVVFGWIESDEMFPTIAELAFAAGNGKLVRYALSPELGRLGPNCHERLFPNVLRTLRMFDCGLDSCLSPRIAFARLFNVPQSLLCNVPQQNAVYFIEDNIERIKIGLSNNPEKRLGELQTGSSNTLRLIGSIPGGRHLEAKLHFDFSHLQLKDEWFHATKELRDFVQRELGLKSYEKSI